MKNTRKLVSLALALVMCLSVMIPASATEKKTYDVGNGITVETGGAMPVMPRIYSFWDDCTRNTYNKSFTIYPVNGNRMTFTINNLGSSTIVVNLFVSGTTIPSLTIPGNSSDHVDFSGNPELSCDVDITIFTTTGANMNVQLRGWQYQVN